MCIKAINLAERVAYDKTTDHNSSFHVIFMFRKSF